MDKQRTLYIRAIDTSLFRHLPQGKAVRMKGAWRFKTIEQGAATQVFLTTNPSVAGISGAYFTDCSAHSPTTLTQDDTLAAKL